MIKREEEKYEKDANKYWDFWHQDKFFKDRHCLDKEWGHYFQEDSETKTILEACDFSPRAVNLVKSHKEFTSDCVNAFVCDLTADDISKQISRSSVDMVTMFLLKDEMPNGLVLLRDYAVGDLAQERLTCKDQMISENFYVRGDGTDRASLQQPLPPPPPLAPLPVLAPPDHRTQEMINEKLKILLAVATGCHVSPTCGVQSVDQVLAAGAKQAVDYTREESHSLGGGRNREFSENYVSLSSGLFMYLVIPGGRAPEYLAMDESVLALVKKFSDLGRPIASVCHGHLILAAAGVDGNLITAAAYEGHPEFNQLFIKVLRGAMSGSDKRILFLRGLVKIDGGIRLMLSAV
ncbi:hypothetical protein C5167_042557 [Papaver somniferum]|uniref:DJ-1/PfpI domain-containing protein n=1 Tax=Papaver somniferum TaxID=3469 RepID=A0A4Y7L5S3_PAPSO|nr:hypothetical protein C5167_042557 [Papaver somniferum]